MKDPVLSAKPGPVVVRRLAAGQRICSAHDCDVCVAGGTLGIFLALALQLKGHRVCVVEKRALQGRSQEWNISRAELHGLVDAGMLTQDELDAAIVTHWDESCMHFKDGGDALRVKDVLNLGVSPRILIDSMKAHFLAAGGQIFEHTAFKSAEVADDGIKVQLQSTPASDVTLTPGDVNRPSAVGKGSTPFTHGNGNINGNINGNHSAPRPTIPRTLTARLLVDVMGHYSPIVKQVRGGQRPDGMVVVVGGCMDGIPAEANTSADLLATITDSFDDTQLFWEAFPAEGGASRTAYMFLYTNAKPSRPNFVDLIQLYLKLLPHYQGVPLSQLKFKRLLYGGFPCYQRRSPLPAAFDRVLQAGDAAATQSPLSFGGFGAMVRHLPRLSRAVDDALKQDRLTRKDLALLQPYQPSLSVSWLFQRAMHIEMGQLRDNTAAKPEALRSPQDSSLKEPKKQKGTRGWLPASHVNKLMRCNFAVMRMLGDRVLKPFVQDSMQLGPLALTMLGMMLRDPFTVTLVLFQVGPGRILDWFRHFFALAAFTALFFALRPLRTVVTSFRFQRLLDALEYGAALDYRHHAAGETASSHAARVEVSGEHNANMKVNGSSVKRRAVEQPTPLYNI